MMFHFCINLTKPYCIKISTTAYAARRTSAANNSICSKQTIYVITLKTNTNSKADNAKCFCKLYDNVKT